MDQQFVGRSRRRWPLLVALLALPTLGFAGCESSSNDLEPAEPRNLLDDEWRSVDRWAEVYDEAPANNRLVRRAQEVFAKLRPLFDGAGNRLVVVGPEGVGRGTDAPFAAALPDGNVVLNWAGLELCYLRVSPERGDSRLALVLAHELAHLKLGHQWFLDAAAMALSLEGESDVVRALRDDLGSNAQEVKKLELQADEMAVIGMAIAEYEPSVVLGEDDSFFAEWVGTPTAQLAYQDESHPSPEMRSTNARGRLTRAAAKVPVFHEGADALEAGDYRAAVRAFEGVKQAFPSREVLSNLGLAHYQLAAYHLAQCDGTLVTSWRMPVAVDHQTLLDRARLRGDERSDCYDHAQYLDHSERAEETLDAAIRQDEQYGPALLNLAALHMLDDRPTWAKAYAGQGVEMLPEEPRFLNAFLTATIAELSATGKSFEEEAAELESLQRSYPNDPEIAFNTARALSLAGAFDRADPIWRSVVRLEPESEWAELARWYLGEDPADQDRPTR